MARSILAVLAGWLVWGVVCQLGDGGVRYFTPKDFDEKGLTESTSILIVLLLLRVGYSIISGATTGLIAATNPMGHVYALCLFNFIFGAVVQYLYRDALPMWFHVVFLVSLIPSILLGGYFSTGLR